MKYCPNCNKQVSDVSKFCPDCGGSVVEMDNIPTTVSGTGYTGNLFNNSLFNDEYGFTVNRVLRGSAIALFIIVPIWFIIALIVGIDMIENSGILAATIIIGGLTMAVTWVFNAIVLLWLATLGNNVAVMRKQSEQDKTKDNSAALPKL